jgi:catechol 2,3-dioxygenase-like lactoylglutathione lyase family enzyme
MAGAKGKTKKLPPAKLARPAPRPKPSAKPPSTKQAAAKPVAAKPAGKSVGKPAAPKSAAPLKPVLPSKPAPAAENVQAPAPSPLIFAPAASKAHVPAKPLQPGDFALDKLHQIALPATNLDLAVEFYRDILGLKFITRFDPPGLAFFALAGGARLLLSVQNSQATLYFSVPDIDAAVAALKKRGVSFLQPPHRIHRDEEGHFGKKGNEEWMVFFKDPSGNTLGLVERR